MYFRADVLNCMRVPNKLETACSWRGVFAVNNQTAVNVS